MKNSVTIQRLLLATLLAALAMGFALTTGGKPHPAWFGAIVLGGASIGMVFNGRVGAA